MLRLSQLHRKTLLGGLTARISRPHDCRGIPFQDLCDDGLEAGLRTRAGGGDWCDAETPKPIYFQPDLDRTEVASRGFERTSAMCGRHEVGVHQSAGPRG